MLSLQDSTTEEKKGTDAPEETPESVLAGSSTATATAPKIRGRKKKNKTKVPKGKVFINSTYNNTIVTVTDPSGNVVVWGSAGKAGFKGSKKSTPYAGGKTMEDALARLKERGMTEVDVYIKGIGSGRESAVRALQGSGLTVLSIKDRTPIPHGGVRQKKVRRV